MHTRLLSDFLSLCDHSQAFFLILISLLLCLTVHCPSFRKVHWTYSLELAYRLSPSSGTKLESFLRASLVLCCNFQWDQ